MSDTTVVHMSEGQATKYIGRIKLIPFVVIGKEKRYYQAKSFGNPFSHQKVKGTYFCKSRELAIMNHMLWLQGKRPDVEYFIRPTLEEIMSLAGHRLGCFCAPQSCHGDNYVTIIERGYL